MRCMSFKLTTQQVRDGTKTVTRRDGWARLNPGARVMACVKCMGLKKGEKVEKIREIEIVSNRPEVLREIVSMPKRGEESEVCREGFPTMTPWEFVLMYNEHNGGTPDKIINRIEFKYV